MRCGESRVRGNATEGRDYGFHMQRDHMYKKGMLLCSFRHGERGDVTPDTPSARTHPDIVGPIRSSDHHYFDHHYIIHPLYFTPCTSLPSSSIIVAFV